MQARYLNHWPLKISALVLVSTFSLGYRHGGHGAPSTPFPETTVSWAMIGDIALSVAASNLTISIILLSGLLTGGGLTLFQLAVTGYLAGADVGYIIKTFGLRPALFGLLPHGIFELSGFVVLGSVGLEGVRLAVRWLHQESPLLEEEYITAFTHRGRLGMALVLLGILTESVVTPLLMGRYLG